MKIHEKYISRCIQLGKNGLGTTAPNPMVGSVIVHDEKIIGEGFTSPYGGSHAEVNAINSVQNKLLLAKSTLYVTLEPCSHFGKTPPCANLIVQHKIPKVIIGITDPNPLVSGNGIQILKNAGCEVVFGVLENECREHHKRFLCSQEKKRPFVILKWAETSDGFIAPNQKLRNNTPEPYWITNKYSRQLVHKWRSEEQAILAGTNTIIEDNPKLNTRSWKGKNPIRIVIDRKLKIPSNFNVFDNSCKTIVITEKTTKNTQNTYFEKVDFSKNLPTEICKIAHKHNISSILVEGGSKTQQSFIDANLWDEARIFKGKNIFIKGLKSPQIQGALISESLLKTDQLLILKND